MKALIVESDLMSQCVLAKLLGERGHETVVFDNGEQAILAYQKEAYPLVFVGADLPGMDGIQFCRWLRSHPEGEKTYIILAHTSGKPDKIQEILAAGASDFLSKPFEVGGLKMRLDVADRQMASFFREKELAEELRRREQEADGLQRELCRAGESLVQEVEERRRIEDAFEGVKTELAQSREAIEQQLQDKAQELCATADQLQSATSFRLKIEDDLKRVRSELEAQSGKHARQMESLSQEMAAEKARAREADDRQRKAMEDLQAKLQAAVAAARKAREKRLSVEQEGRRAAESFAKTRAEFEQRQVELVEELNALRERVDAGAEERATQEIKTLSAERAALRQELDEAREEYACRMTVHAEQLLRLDRELHAALEARGGLETELVQVRESLAQQAKDYAAAVMQAGAEVEKAIRERLGVLEAAAQERERLESELSASERRVGELRAAQTKGEGERRELEEELQKAWQELEKRPVNGREIGSLPAQEVSELQRVLAEERERCAQLEVALRQERAHVEARLRRVAAALDPSEQDLIPAG